VAGIPEEILRLTAEARAAAEGRDVEDVLAEMRVDAPRPVVEDGPVTSAPAAVAAPVPVVSTPLPAGGIPKIPESLLRRTAEIRAKAQGRDIEEVLTELRKGVAPSATAPLVVAPAAVAAAVPTAAEPAAAAPEAVPAPTAPAAEPLVTATAASSGPDLTTLAEQTGVPAHLLERSVRARAQAEGKPYLPPGSAVPPAGAPAAPAPDGGGPAAAPAAAPIAALPEGVRTQRLLTVVKAGAIQQVKKEPTDKVNTWPHLVAIEFVALMVVTAALFIFSVFVDAPLLEFANFNDQPNPSKAPWYFLGLQELLSYFDPAVAGVVIPGFGLAGLAFIPYIDRNPSVRPSDRKLAIMIFTFFVMAAGILTIFGSFFRGPGFNFVFPWVDGIFFDF
jgi:menaquinol-cytochrome c reductase cytochrome b/c subunit